MKTPSLDRFHEHWPSYAPPPYEEPPEPQPHCEVCGERLEPRHFIVVCDCCAELETDAECARIHEANSCPARPSEVRLRRYGFEQIKGFWVGPVGKCDGTLMNRAEATAKLNELVEAKAI